MSNTPPQELTISVTGELIDVGSQCDDGSCPIALAINKALPGYEASVKSNVLVRVVADLDDAVHVYRFEEPERVKRFIDSFDIHGKHSVSPFSTKLTLEY